MNGIKRRQPWIDSRMSDSLFILAPPFVALLLVSCFPVAFKNSTAMPLACWVILIVAVDVAHVYSTLFRTYFRPPEGRPGALLYSVPLACYAAGILLYSADALVFWRVLAYLAVFHFVRQQYGFMRLYSRNEVARKGFRLIDSVTIYAATLYPLLYWHLSSGRRFNWFIDGDFLSFQADHWRTVFGWLYCLVLAAYCLKELIFIAQTRRINIPRNAVISGTALSWYFGIVYYNGDMAFTTLNVVSHGIPYMALVWFAERKRVERPARKTNLLQRAAFSRYSGVWFFAGLLILFAFIEEGLWDGLVWREHLSFFRMFRSLPVIENNVALIFLIPLLSLPQSTHYVLDGFIWKRKSAGPL